MRKTRASPLQRRTKNQQPRTKNRVPISFRQAGPDDSRRIWEWRNDPDARAASFNTEIIPFETHLEWYARRMRNGEPLVYIATNGDGVDIGYVRFDVAGESAEISVCLDPAYRHRGLGRTVIADGARLALHEGVARRVVALVRLDNSQSLAAFQAAGFVVSGRDRRAGVDAWILHFEDPQGGSF